ncbi:MAG: hypothetical protein BWY91_02295 [bacterium ADurb.BinA028]|nr:MAG: hypothetical protein BWY91_02295 [bacterium ADurb.BinA028]
MGETRMIATTVPMSSDPMAENTASRMVSPKAPRML